MAEEFRPKIVGFLCNWCSYAGADLAGATKLEIPSSLSVIRVMCSGRVDPVLVATALLHGADGVLVAGCHPGDCNYINGNYKTIRRFYFLEVLLKAFGVDTERLRMHFISAGEGIEFQKKVNQFIRNVKELGPANYGVKE